MRSIAIWLSLLVCVALIKQGVLGGAPNPAPTAFPNGCPYHCKAECARSGCSCPAGYCEQICFCDGGGEAICQCNRECGECFPGNGQVTLEDGHKVNIETLQIGDKVLAMNSQGEPEFSEVRLLGHASAEARKLFLKINTPSASLRMTKNHHIFVVDPKTGELVTKFAEELKVGDSVRVMSGDKFVVETVEDITPVLGNGVYAPVTWAGNLVVDGVAVSSYAQWRPQYIPLVRALLTPIMHWPWLEDYLPIGRSKTGIHPWVVSMYLLLLRPMEQYLGFDLSVDCGGHRGQRANVTSLPAEVPIFCHGNSAHSGVCLQS